jgi:hypothetical protein
MAPLALQIETKYDTCYSHDRLLKLVLHSLFQVLWASTVHLPND